MKFRKSAVDRAAAYYHRQMDGTLPQLAQMEGMGKEERDKLVADLHDTFLYQATQDVPVSPEARATLDERCLREVCERWSLKRADISAVAEQNRRQRRYEQEQRRRLREQNDPGE